MKIHARFCFCLFLPASDRAVRTGDISGMLRPSTCEIARLSAE
jgi:hypothetical protein